MVEAKLDGFMMLSCELDIELDKDDVTVNFTKISPNLEENFEILTIKTLIYIFKIFIKCLF